jgi:hypothetical protein
MESLNLSRPTLPVKSPMRHLRLLPFTLGFALSPLLSADPVDPPTASLVTVTFSSALGEVLHDRRAENLDDSFTFALGVFDGFQPTSDNTGDWFDNFVPFFIADFRDTPPAGPRFGGEAELLPDGSSSANPATAGDFSFFGMDAWLWVYNGVNIDTETEWFLGRANDWVFPTLADIQPPEEDCVGCPGSFPVQWALSDLFQTAPVWGRREAQEGAGFVLSPNEAAKLQTYAVIPEPRTWVFVLGLLSVFALHYRRRFS